MAELNDVAWAVLGAAHELQRGDAKTFVGPSEIRAAVLTELDVSVTAEEIHGLSGRHVGLETPFRVLADDSLVEISDDDMPLPTLPGRPADFIDSERQVHVTDAGREALAGRTTTP